MAKFIIIPVNGTYNPLFIERYAGEKVVLVTLGDQTNVPFDLDELLAILSTSLLEAEDPATPDIVMTETEE